MLISRYFLLVFLLLPMYTFGTSTPSIIFIMGPSCSGKSTIASQLFKYLGNTWKLIEYDWWEDTIGRHNATEHEIFAAMIHDTEDQLQKGYSVVIDTNTYFPALCTSLCKPEYYIENVYIYAPLEILLQRYEKRRKNNNHSLVMAEHMRTFIVNNFMHFYPTSIPEQKDAIIIDTTCISIDQAISLISNSIN